MSKIVDEIIDNLPELEKDKDVLLKTVSFLDENKPDIKIDNNFKKSLKSRLDWLISIKEWRKNKFSIFAIPVFSFVFAIGGFVYYFNDIDLFFSEWKITTETISEGNIEIKEIMEIGEILDFEINNIIEEDNSNKVEWLKEDNEAINLKLRSVNKIEEPILGDKIMHSKVNVNKMESNDSNLEADTYEVNNFEISNSEDNSIVEMFWLSELEDSNWLEGFAENIAPSNMSRWSFDSEFMESDDEGGYVDSKEFGIMVDVINFDDYCYDLWWSLTWTWGLEKCILNEKECFSSKFENWTCEFEEIK